MRLLIISTNEAGLLRVLHIDKFQMTPYGKGRKIWITSTANSFALASAQRATFTMNKADPSAETH